MANPTRPGKIAATTADMVPQVRTAAGFVITAPERLRIVFLVGALIVVILATAAAQVRLNSWNQPFYDAIERRNLAAFGQQLIVFFMIAGVLLVLNVSQTGLNQYLRVLFRQVTARRMIETWLSGTRAAQISRAGDIGVNPDQRIHSDAQRLADLTTNLVTGALQSTILLASFIGVLWVMSSGVTLEFRGRTLSIPGYMVWAALIYAASWSWLSWLVGRPLIGYEIDRSVREADLRAALVRTSDRADDISLARGEAAERGRLITRLDEALAVARQIVRADIRLTWVRAGFGWVALVVPVIVASPGYFNGSLTFGELMVVVGAFTQVQLALRWFVDNIGPIAEWRATLARVTNFQRALEALAIEDAGQVKRDISQEGKLALDDLVVHSAHGDVAPAEPHVDVAPGERVLLYGAPATGKSALFLTMAGLWNKGSGRICLPPAGEMALLSQQPFLPWAPLREVLAGRVPVVDDERIVAALDRVGLSRLADQLDRCTHWDSALSLGDQERLAYARILLAHPKWIICDEGLRAADDDNRILLQSVLENELADCAVVNIGASRLPERFYNRVIDLVSHPRSMPTQARQGDHLGRP